MKVKLKSWDEVVKLAKERGDYDDCFGGMVYSLTRQAAPWGEWVEGEFDSYVYFMVDDDACPYYLKLYMIEYE